MLVKTAYMFVVGAPARADDFDDLTQHRWCIYVEEGTANADAGFVVTADGATVGTSDIDSYSSLAQVMIIAGAAMTKLATTRRSCLRQSN